MTESQRNLITHGAIESLAKSGFETLRCFGLIIGDECASLNKTMHPKATRRGPYDGFLKSLSVENKIMAESEGFEPSIGINLYTLSRRAPSAARPALQI